jgi:hypothetical protein
LSEDTEELASRVKSRLEQKRLQAFLSYSTRDRGLAKRLKNQLERLGGIRVFVAPSDIKPNREGWRKTIIKKVRECDVFLALLTKHFRKSEWTDQETGIAVAYGKLIISLRVGKITARGVKPNGINPHGFLESYQTQNIGSRLLGKYCPEILTAIRDDRKLRSGLQSSFINAFNMSNSYPDANDRSELLEMLGPYDAEKVNSLFLGYLRNTNIHHGFRASGRVIDLLIRNKKAIRPALMKQAHKVPESLRSEYLHFEELLG